MEDDKEQPRRGGVGAVTRSASLSAAETKAAVLADGGFIVFLGFEAGNNNRKSQLLRFPTKSNSRNYSVRELGGVFTSPRRAAARSILVAYTLLG